MPADQSVLLDDPFFGFYSTNFHFQMVSHPDLLVRLSGATDSASSVPHAEVRLSERICSQNTSLISAIYTRHPK